MYNLHFKNNQIYIKMTLYTFIALLRSFSCSILFKQDLQLQLLQNSPLAKHSQYLERRNEIWLFSYIETWFIFCFYFKDLYTCWHHSFTLWNHFFTKKNQVSKKIQKKNKKIFSQFQTLGFCTVTWLLQGFVFRPTINQNNVISLSFIIQQNTQVRQTFFKKV